VDLDSHVLSYTKDGRSLGTAFTLRKEFHDQALYPAVVLKNAEMTFNFGGAAFAHSPPAGFAAINSAPSEATAQGQGQGAKAFKPKNNAPQAIILEPSRELAEQTLKQMELFGEHLEAPRVRSLLVVGGVPVREQMRALEGGVDVVCGTPGRLEELVNTGQLALTSCRFLVLDEADGLLKAGHEKFINSLHGSLPKTTPDGRNLQMVVCSATLHSFEVKRMAERLMRFPAWIDLKGQDAVPETVHHVVCRIDPRSDGRWRSLRSHVATDGVHARDNVNGASAESLSEGVKRLKGEFVVAAIDTHSVDKAIVFCRTKLDCDNLERYLQQKGGSAYSCVCLHGDRKPNERRENLEAFKRDKVRFLICTDVAARGLDIRGLPFAINVTLPDEKSNYVHRIGRVGRAERMGLAISLVSDVPEKVWYHGEWCKSRGRNCNNTRLTSQSGCCVWYDEPQYLADIEEHLGITIPSVGADLKVPVNEFDGRVVYGERNKNKGTGYQTHVEQLAPAVSQLQQLEVAAQQTFLNRQYGQLYPWSRI